MPQSPTFFAKPRAEHFPQFPRCTVNSVFPVETVALRAGQVQVELRTSAVTTLWLSVTDVELLNPVPALVPAYSRLRN
ncbi:hypothetical protein [Candidatus Cyanaurora vandensis]|uniref:hypothetical protein n=1 Tax=Candidatus Cyanaurora vandensis TaxID=2714958 RepID=UPI00257F8751|nr:hypothetical protein [Candidatus Cyanaurora vandensis]